MQTQPLEYNAHAVVWELTLACNLKCAHCASTAGRRRDNELTREEALKLCHDLPGIGAGAVCLFGGEFHLRKGWEEIGETLRSLGLDVSVATNGYAFDQALADKVKALEIDGISVSLDAADPTLHDAIRGRRGAHDRAVRAIGLIDSMGFQGSTIITSVTKRNLGELDAMGDLIAGAVKRDDWMWMLNIASCHDPERFGAALGLDEHDYLDLAHAVQRLRRRHGPRLDVTGSHDLGYFSWAFPDIVNYTWQGCRAGIDTIGIHSDGGVKGCLILPDRFMEGNLRETPIRDLWTDPERFRLVRGFRTDMLEGDCKGCAFGAVCKGGCKDLAASVTGSPYHFPWCLHRLEMAGLEEEKETLSSQDRPID